MKQNLMLSLVVMSSAKGKFFANTLITYFSTLTSYQPSILISYSVRLHVTCVQPGKRMELESELEPAINTDVFKISVSLVPAHSAGVLSISLGLFVYTSKSPSLPPLPPSSPAPSRLHSRHYRNRISMKPKRARTTQVKPQQNGLVVHSSWERSQPPQLLRSDSQDQFWHLKRTSPPQRWTRMLNSLQMEKCTQKQRVCRLSRTFWEKFERGWKVIAYLRTERIRTPIMRTLLWYVSHFFFHFSPAS